MCGIVGYVGKNAKENALENLKSLEYRGYDSAGIAFFKNNEMYIVKEKGFIENLTKKSKNYTGEIKICIGHTRWATTGKANTRNAHPHLSMNGNWAVVHNGIIENYKQLKDELIQKGYKFRSQTDTEVISNLLEEQSKNERDIIKIIETTTEKLKGSYALAILCTSSPDKIYLTKYNMPLFISVSDKCISAASAVLGLSKFSNEYLVLENNDIAVLNNDNSLIYNNGKIIQRRKNKIKNTDTQIISHNYKHFMLKEILEQETALKNTHEQFLLKKYNCNEIIFKLFENISRVYLIACGTAYHASIVGAKLLCKIGYDCTSHIASEFKYNPPPNLKNSLCIFVSQSGETADTLGALRLAKKSGARTLGITNVESSSLAHEVEEYILTHAGAEIAVASTKAYTCQCLIFHLLQEILSSKMQKINIKQLKINKILQNFKQYRKIAKLINNYAKIFFIGRGMDSITAKEGSLKLKEISYIMSESYPAGELKHGSLALIDSTTLSIIISTEKSMIPKLQNTLDEIKSRNGKIMIISPFDEYSINADIFIKIPEIKNELYYSIT